MDGDKGNGNCRHQTCRRCIDPQSREPITFQCRFGLRTPLKSTHDDFPKSPDIVSPPSPQTNKHSKASDDNRDQYNHGSKNVPMRRSAKFRVTRCESDDQTCTHCGTCRSKNKTSFLNLPKRFVPVGGGKLARWRLYASNVLGNMTYPCNNIHPNIWAAQPQYAGMSLDASNI